MWQLVDTCQIPLRLKKSVCGIPPRSTLNVNHCDAISSISLMSTNQSRTKNVRTPYTAEMLEKYLSR